MSGVLVAVVPCPRCGKLAFMSGESWDGDYVWLCVYCSFAERIPKEKKGDVISEPAILKKEDVKKV